MSGNDHTPRPRPIRRGTMAEGVAVLVGIAFFIVVFIAVRSTVLGGEDPAPWVEILAADSAFRAGAVPNHVPSWLTGTDSTIWVIYELRDERRRRAGSIFTDSALAHARCRPDCELVRMDSLRLDLYRERAIGDFLARTDLELERATGGWPFLAAIRDTWRGLRDEGFGFPDLLVLIAGGIAIVLILRLVPETR